MILIHIERIAGSVQFPGYKDYFVAESFDFGVGRKITTSETNKYDMEISDSEEQELTIEKQVDAATVYLMHAAMQGRTTAEGPRTLSIDIHLVHTRRYEDATTSRESANPFLKIRIENAIIQDWSISGSQDEWPSETIKIMFNRAAMKFRAFVDTKTTTTYGPLGWDQQDNTDWRSDVLSQSSF